MLDNWYVENWFIGVAVAIIYLVTSKMLTGSTDKNAAAGKDQIEQKSTEKQTPTADADDHEEIIWQNIRHRRSIFPKNYSPEESVGEDKIWKILEAANWAPTHGKTEPWRFVVIERSEFQNFLKVVEGAMETIEPAEAREKKLAKLKKKGSKKLMRCSHLIAILRKKVPKPRKGGYMAEWEETAAVSCAVQNMHLMATALQVGCYWSSSGVGKNMDGYMQHEQLRRFFHLDNPEDKCLGLLHVGVPSPGLKVRAKRGDIKDKVVWVRTKDL